VNTTPGINPTPNDTPPPIPPSYSKMAGTHNWSGVQYFAGYSMGGSSLDTSDITFSDSITILDSPRIRLITHGVMKYPDSIHYLNYFKSDDIANTLTFIGKDTSLDFDLYDTLIYNHSTNAFIWHEKFITYNLRVYYFVHSP
jgi:hypothetical protein